MTDDKVITLPTDYKPEPKPVTPSDIEEVKWALAFIQDELELLSKRVNQLTRLLKDRK